MSGIETQAGRTNETRTDNGKWPAELSVGPTSWPSPLRAWLLVAVLSLAYILSYLDRIVINLLVDPIQAEFQIGDAAFGALQGVAFGLFYTLFAIPIGRLVDTGPRRRIIAIGVLVFGTFSMLSGLARSYAMLFLTRIGVGAGEASITPAAYSLISDSFPPERLGKALAVFTMNAFLGIGLAYLIGGAVIAALEGVGTVDVPLLGALKPWQLTFILVGAPALIIGPLIYLCREPKRMGGDDEAPKISEVFDLVWSERAVFGWLFAGFAIVTFSSYASAVWSPAFLIRVHAFSAADVGLALGLIYLFFGPGGAILGGWLSDHLTQKGVTDAPLRVAAFGYIGAGVFGGLAPIAPTPELAIAGLALATIFATIPYPLAATAIQIITPNRMRGQVSALYMTVINLVGLGLGPVVVGALTDFVFSEPSDVRYSLALVNAAAAPFVLLFLWQAFAPFRERRRMQKEQADAS